MRGFDQNNYVASDPELGVGTLKAANQPKNCPGLNQAPGPPCPFPRRWLALPTYLG